MKIALLGSAPSSIGLAPFKDASFAKYMGGRVAQFPTPKHIAETWEIWCCSPGAWAAGQRADRWFELHRWEPEKPWFSPEYQEFLTSFNGPVYTGGPVPAIRNHVVYPIDEMEDMFGPFFFSSSLSLMWALAIAEIEHIRAARRKAAVPSEIATETARKAMEALGKDEEDFIGMWGVDMAANEEYGDQRSGCQHYILEAYRRGITVYLPPESDITRPKPVYGISEWDHNYIKSTARMRELGAKATQLTNEVNSKTSELMAVKGEMGGLKYFVDTWTSPYGLPAGTYLRHLPGTGLGAGKTVFHKQPEAGGAQAILGRPAPAGEAEATPPTGELKAAG